MVAVPVAVIAAILMPLTMLGMAAGNSIFIKQIHLLAPKALADSRNAGFTVSRPVLVFSIIGSKAYSDSAVIAGSGPIV